MEINRRSFLSFLLTTAAATTVDFEQLLWVPKPIIVVPELPWRRYGNNPNMGQLIAEAWEEAVGDMLEDNIFNHRWLLEQWAAKGGDVIITPVAYRKND